MKTFVLMSSLVLLASVSFARAETATGACPADPTVALTQTWAAWKTPAALNASADAAKAPDVAIGSAYTLALAPSAGITYSVQPYRAPTAGTFGGILSLKITTGGVYSIGVDKKAWIDVIKDGQSLKPVGHSEGIVCTAIKKTVDFQLSPGVYAVQLSNAGDAALALEIQAK